MKKIIPQCLILQDSDDLGQFFPNFYLSIFQDNVGDMRKAWPIVKLFDHTFLPVFVVETAPSLPAKIKYLSFLLSVVHSNPRTVPICFCT